MKFCFEHNNVKQTAIKIVSQKFDDLTVGYFDLAFKKMTFTDRRRLYFKLQALSMHATDILLSLDEFYLVEFDKTVFTKFEQARTGLR